MDGGYNIFPEGNKIIATNLVEEITTATIYLNNSNDETYFEVKKRVEHYYIISKDEYSKTVVKVKILLHSFPPTGLSQ